MSKALRLTAAFVLTGAVTLGVVAATQAPAPQTVDLLIKGGTVVDGTGAPRRRADVAIKDGQIVAVGAGLKVNAASSIDATGLIVAPGFIDPHNHSHGALADGSRPNANLNERYIRQGVATVVGGPDGDASPARIKNMLDAYRKTGVGTNVAFYVGHNGIRSEVMGKNQDRAPTAEELEKMRALVREGMQEGTVGLSTGLMYSPGLFSETDEVVALAKEVTPFHGVYESHVRDPHRGLLQSDWEAIQIGRLAGIAVDLTHLTTPGRTNRGLHNAVIELVNDARKEGMNVIADQYPYNAVATMQLWNILNYPASLNLRERDDIRAALKDPEKRAQIERETLTGGPSGFSQYKASGPDSLMILVCPGCENLEGKFITEVAAQRNVNTLDAIADLLVNTPSDIVLSAGGFYEESVKAIMRQPWTTISSDGAPDGQMMRKFGAEHPRSTGAFPRVLGVYVREQKVLTLEDAVRKMTSATADFLGLTGRGRLKTGAAADVTIFDADKIKDRSTWKDPNAAPVGVVDVIVNGQIVMKDGAMTGKAPGQYIRHGGKSDKLQPT